MKEKKRGRLSWLLPLGFWVLVWQGAVLYIREVLQIGGELILPSPWSVCTTLVALMGSVVFWQTALATLLRIFAGLLAGIFVGTLIAICTSAWDWADRLLSPAVRIIRATPVASFILLVILWAPTGRVPGIVAALMVLPVVWGNVSRGIAQADPLLLEMARAYRFGIGKTVRLVYLPLVLPYFAAGCHTALGLAWKAGVAAEVLCVPKLAIGTQIYFSKSYLETPTLFAWTIVVIVLSFLLEGILGAMLSRLEGGTELDKR